jgi:hypothetical protein
MKARIVLALALLPVCAHAEIFRCAVGGAVTYQEIPCPAAATGGATLIPDAYPEINHTERNRLLQREAALDSRMLKRAEIDSAERIASNELAVREREALAAREAAAAAASQNYAPVYGYRPVYGAPRLGHRNYPIRSGPPRRM